MSLDSFGQLMYFSIVFGYCFNFHNSSKILSFPFMSGKNNIFKYLPSASVLFFFSFFMKLLTVLQTKSSVFKIATFWKMWMDSTLNEPEKSVTCFQSNWWLSCNRHKVNLITGLHFLFFQGQEQTHFSLWYLATWLLFN